jgi:malate dehydrogenase (oxaloacetate-decarboxylating)
LVSSFTRTAYLWPGLSELAAAQAIASVVSDDELDPEYIIPSVFNRDVASAVATAVAEAAQASGVARRPRRPASG